jgi:glycosyltransferase 2 family protein
MIIQVVVLLIVGLGIVHTGRKARQQLNAQRQALIEQARQAQAEAEGTNDPVVQQRKLAEAQALLVTVDHFWYASPSYLLGAGIVYMFGMWPAYWYWRQCLLAMDQHVPSLATHWAYFFGNLGKYFPGKAMVVVLRLAALSEFGVKKVVTTVTIFMETLTMMAVGGACAAICLLLLNLDWRLTAISLGLLVTTFIPTLPPVLRWIILLLQPGVPSHILTQWTGRIHFGLIAKGWLALSLTWILFGLSLQMVLQGLAISEGSQVPWHVNSLSCLGASALAVVLGFVSLVPGGAGVRELVLSAILTPVFGPTAALCGAVWLRITWLAAELAIVAILAALKFVFPPPAKALHSDLPHA